MKSNYILAACLIVFLTIFSHTSFAGSDSHGGDLLCDAKVKAIANNIREWIAAHGAEVGDLDLSSSKNPKNGSPFTLAEYDSTMLDLFKLPLDSSCVAEGDPGYPVKVGDDSKVCVSSVDSTGLHLRCDQGKLLGMGPDLQIEQIHHEYATNIPGLEPDYGPISTYKISSQLAAYTQMVTERRLVVTPPQKAQDSGTYLSDLLNLPTDGADQMHAYLIHFHMTWEKNPYDLLLPGDCRKYDPSETLKSYAEHFAKNVVPYLTNNGINIKNSNYHYSYSGTDAIAPFFNNNYEQNKKAFVEPYGQFEMSAVTAENVPLTIQVFVRRVHNDTWRTWHKNDSAFFQENGFGIDMTTEKHVSYDTLGRIVESATNCLMTGLGAGIKVLNSQTGRQIFEYDPNH